MGLGLEVTWRVEWAEEVGSTNDVMLDRLARGVAGPYDVLAARRQTGGRGRGARRWHSPEGSLYLSAVIPLPTAVLGWAALGAGIAVALAVGDLGASAGVKWPNDVLLGGRKLAGVLVETHGGPCGVVGIGLNVGDPTPADPALAASLAYLREEVPDVTPADALEALLPRLAEIWDHLLAAETDRLATLWSEMDAAAGADVTWLQGPPSGVRPSASASGLRGTALGPDSQGALRIRLPNGETVTATAGEVFMTRSPRV